jgi:DNA-directed RNA polymerase subunit RPC12/RpoP
MVKGSKRQVKLTTRPSIQSVQMTYTYQKNANGEFVCHICQAVKKNQNTMHYHLKNHEGHLPFECPTCKKEFLHSQTLAVHVAARHSKQEAAALKCPACPYKTLTKANRVIHFMRKHCHTDVAALKATGTTCPTCSKVCNSSTAFLYHLSTGCITLSEERQGQLDCIL